MEFIAHISEDKKRIHTVREHIFDTAELCYKSGIDTGVADLCYLCGLFHDVGKLTEDFTDYISGKNADVRRFHRLENSVIIMDEVQSIPVKCVYLFNLAVNYLTKICGCTVVLCTATQPNLDDLEYPVFLDERSSMSGDYEDDFNIFKRTEIISCIKKEGYSFKETADFCFRKSSEYNSVLIIVNTKRASAEIYNEISKHNKQFPEENRWVVIHLSTNMCPQHRRDKIKYIKQCILTRECACEVSPCVFGEGKGAFDNTGEINFGFSYSGITYPDEAINENDKDMLTVRFSEVVMKNGIITFMRPEDFPENQKRHIRPMKMKIFGKEFDNFTGLEE